MLMEHYRPWLVLNMLPGLGKTRINRLINHFKSPEAVLDASEKELEAIEGVGAMGVSSILKWKSTVDVEAELRLIEQHGVSLVSILDDAYPANLARMHVPPPLLYYKGTLEPIDEAAVAVIGSRRVSRYGRDAAHEIVSVLAEAGVTVVSGLAIGCDGVAHEMALDAGGRTLAVLGGGLSSIYPAQHQKLAGRVVENGALISEMPIASEIDPGSFPQRNAIISGLSLGVLVIEAGPRSGTSITVGCALEENRAVYAVPGDITRVNSVGTNRLIKEGARLVTCADDILVDLRRELGRLIDGLPDGTEDLGDTPPPVPKDLTETESSVYEALELDPLQIDALAEALGGTVSSGDLMAALLSLELRGLVRQEPGMRFRRTK
jgi:DNA processing protein